MSLSPVKKEILETMLLNEKPMKAMEIANETKKQFQSTMGHLLGLIRMKYISQPQKGHCIITEQGKQALGIPEITKEKATEILAYAPHDKAFNFYVDVDKPLQLHAHSLRDFVNKLERVDASSVDFHNRRNDFEAWFRGLGDEELAKKSEILKQKSVVGDDLCKQLRVIVEQRYLTLAKLAGQSVPLQ
jgi:hypothetical protein